MGRVVRIYGTARNLSRTPPPSPGEEVWIANGLRVYANRLKRPLEGEVTRYFNLHSWEHMEQTYPHTIEWLRKTDIPVYLQKAHPSIPTSFEFPRHDIQEAFGGNHPGSPGRYFTCSIAWQLAYAILEQPAHIDLWGYRLSDKKGGRINGGHAFERPCFFYWVEEARKRGIQVTYPQEVADLPYVPGDPAEYRGPLYGYGTTKPYADIPYVGGC